MQTKLLTAIVIILGLASAPVAAEISGGAVKIGVLTDMSGLYSDNLGQGTVIASQMAIEDWGGEVLGKPIELVYADNQNKPDISISIAGRWLDVEGVDMVIGGATSAVSLAVQNLVDEKNSVFLMPDAASSDLTGKACNDNSIHWVYDTEALANGTGSAVVKAGGETWFFITVDYAFGHALQRDVAEVVEANGGKVLGSVQHPLNASDFSSYVLQAQASGAEIVGLANGGGDTINAIKAASEFGLVQGGQKLAGLLVLIGDVHSLGLEAAQGLLLTSAFYWDRTDETREWSKRFFERHGKMPTSIQAGYYSAILHYLKAVEALGSDQPGDAVVAKMKGMKTSDPLFGGGYIRPDGRKMHDMYLFEVKSPEQSEEPWDYFELIRTIPAKEAFGPMTDECPLVEEPGYVKEG